METRYAVHFGFHYRFPKDAESTYITTDTAGEAIPRLPADVRQSYLDRGYISELPGEPSTAGVTVPMTPAQLAPQPLGAAQHASKSAHARRKGGE